MEMDDIKKRHLELFMSELTPLLEKYNCEIIARPFIDDDGRILAQPIVILKETV